jgi:hypothetical protein
LHRARIDGSGSFTAPPRRQSLNRAPVPPHQATQFTVSELAALRTVADQIKRHGTCAGPRVICLVAFALFVASVVHWGAILNWDCRRGGRRGIPCPWQST